MLSEEQVKEYESKHGDVVHCVGPRATPTAEPAWELVMRRPKRAEYRFYKTNLQSDRTKVDANTILLSQCTVFPDPVALDALLEKFWAIPDSEPVQKALAYFGGLDVDHVGK